MNDIYIKIKSIRLKKGLKQEEIAEKLKMTQSNYARLERGLTQITFERLEELAGVFEMSIENILNFEETTDFKEDAKYYYKELQKALNKIKNLEKENQEITEDDFWIKESRKHEGDAKDLRLKMKQKDLEIERLKKLIEENTNFKNEIVNSYKQTIESQKQTIEALQMALKK